MNVSQNNNRFQELFERWFKNQASDEDMEELKNIYQVSLKEAGIEDALKTQWISLDKQLLYSEDQLDTMAKNITGREAADDEEISIAPKQIHRIHFLRRGFFRYAAAIIIVLGIGAAWFVARKTNERSIANIQPYIQPGSDKAILTLSDGRKVVLNDSMNQLITDGKTAINKSNGIIAYNPVLTSETATISYNTMSTPRGGQYQLVLPDGSKVWLNSASSLKYPVQFSAHTREVELNGEAYFEIQENKSKPFIVRAKKVNVQVLGTGFNINAYDDEPVIATTLVEGAVKVSTSANNAVVIKPGQQAFVSSTSASSDLQVRQPNMTEVLAWKKGRFEFDGADITAIMRQISRWYDIKVEYEGNIPTAVFSGSLLRSGNPFTLLNALELTDEVHFNFHEKTIHVIAGSKPKQ